MTNTASGGVAAAAGLGFQYLATVETLLDRLSAGDEDFVLTTEDSRDAAIDFSISEGDSLLLIAQAKAAVDGPLGPEMSPAEVLKVARRLLGQDAQEYLIITNRPLSAKAIRLVEAIGTLQSAQTAQQARHAIVSADAGADAALSKIPDEALQRMHRLRVNAREEPVEAHDQRVADRIRDLRRRSTDGAGADSARVLLRYLVAEILIRSGRRVGRSMPRSEAVDLLGISGRTIAHSIGRYDWGTVTGAVPVQATVRRAGLLDDMFGILDGPPAERALRELVLVGMSGIGKSSLAASFCEMATTRYDRTVWFDASSQQALRNQAAQLLGEQAQNLPTDQVAAMLRQTLSESPNSWLLVFDNAPGASELAAWMPPRGHVDVIATSTDATTWHQWPALTVPAMDPLQAAEIVRMRLAGTEWTSADDARAQHLADILECWPLAIELACAFLQQSGRGIAATDEYLQRLAEQVIDDSTLIPAEYRTHPTLLAAIFVALDTVEAADRRSTGLSATTLLRVLAYLPARDAPVDLAGRIAIWLQHTEAASPGHLESNEAAVDLLIDGAVRGLATASLVERHLGASPLGGSARCNAIVLDVARALHDDDARANTLATLQFVLGEHLDQALTKEQYPRANALVTSGLCAMEHSVTAGVITREGVVLLGNVGNFLLRQGDFQAALTAFERELDLVASEGRRVDPLRAKIHSSMLLAKLHLARDEAELIQDVELALSAIERAVASEPSQRDNMAQPGLQIAEVLRVLRDSQSFSHQHLILAWQSRIDAALPAAVGRTRTADVASSLRAVDNDDEQTLRSIDAQLADGAGTHQRLTLLFCRADCLTELQRYDDAAAAFMLAAAEARAQSLGLAIGWSSIINAWRHAAARILGHDDVRAQRRLCRTLDALTADEDGSTPDETAALSVLRAATSVERGPMELATRRVRDIDDASIAPTYLTNDVTITHAVVRACRDILELRQ